MPHVGRHLLTLCLAVLLGACAHDAPSQVASSVSDGGSGAVGRAGDDGASHRDPDAAGTAAGAVTGDDAHGDAAELPRLDDGQVADGEAGGEPDGSAPDAGTSDSGPGDGGGVTDSGATDGGALDVDPSRAGGDASEPADGGGQADDAADADGDAAGVDGDAADADGDAAGVAGDAAGAADGKADAGPPSWGPAPTSAGKWSPTLKDLGHNDFGGPIECNDVAAGPGDIVFLCTSLDGLKVIDTQQSAKLPVLATTDFSVGSAMAPKCHHVSAAVVDGQWRVWVTWRGDNHQPNSTLTEVLYTPPSPGQAAKLVETAHVAEPGHSLEGMTWQHNRLWLAAHQTGVDVMARVAGKLVRTRTVGGLTNAWDVAVAGNQLAVADGPAGLAMIASATPEKSKVVGKLAFGGMATRVVVAPSGDVAYVAAAEAGLVIADLTNPTQPKLKGTLVPPTSVADVALSGSHALLAAIDRVYVADVSQAAAPELIGARRTAPTSLGSAYHLAVEAVGKRVISTEWMGLSAWQLADIPAAPALVVEARELHLQVELGGAVVRDVTLHNAGNRWLYVQAAKLASPVSGLSIEQVPTAIPPGGSADVVVRYQSQGAGAESTTLSITCDDPHEPVTTVALHLMGTPKSVSVAPTVSVQRIDGTTWTTAQHPGKVRLLSYFSTFCPMAWNHFGQSHRSLLSRVEDPDLVVVGVMADPAQFNVPLPADDALRLVHFQDVLSFDPVIGFDLGGGKTALIPQKTFNAPAPVPVDVLIGRDGRVIRVAPRYDPLGMASDIEAALAIPAPKAP